jgi:hypothetical protein
MLIALLYYLHDMPKLVRIQERMEFCAHCLVNMLQNCSQSRATSKNITFNDIRYAVRSAYLAFYPSTTMYATGTRQHPLGHFPLGFIYYVSGNSDNTASVVWAFIFHMDTNASEKVIITRHISTHRYSMINILQNVAPTAIYPGLKINLGEKKIILECSCCYHNKPGDPDTFSDGRKCPAVPVKTAFGLYITTPKARVECYFNSIVIFTPKPDLFNETLPQ